MTEWFEQWFGEEYHTLYPHRDEEDARRAVALVRRVAPWRPGDRVLDLACGAGRHAAELERHGARVVGFDLSLAMLLRARGRTRAPLVRGDMRALPFQHGLFAVAVNLFTSFGYFREDAEHRHVVGEVAEVLTPGGRFVLDYLNADQVRCSLKPVEQFARGATSATVSRVISEDGRFVIKTIRLRDEGRSFQERVRLFTPGELAELLEASGFRVAERCGDYDASPLTPASPRAIFVGVRA
ncbi:MAG: methyltransferase domain-containing protein [Gemmatimonadetes bacterium]|nr:methyltransferase domain-containing protein [Gemmatimonadota bacterium]